MEGNFEIYPAGVKGAAEQQKTTIVENRLQQVTDMDDTKVLYEYNGLGTRVGQ